MPLTFEMAYLLHFDVCPIQLLPLVVLISELAKLLEEYFSIKFGFEEIVLIRVVEKQ